MSTPYLTTPTRKRCREAAFNSCRDGYRSATSLALGSMSFGHSASASVQLTSFADPFAGNTTTATVANLADGATYYFVVKAYESGFSNQVSQSLTVAVAGFSADKTSGIAPVTVSFTDSSTGSITSRSWDFGDGTTGTGTSLSHTYSTAGNHTVTGTGGSATASKTISVTNPAVAAPVASFTASPTSESAPLLARSGAVHHDLRGCAQLGGNRRRRQPSRVSISQCWKTGRQSQ